MTDPKAIQPSELDQLPDRDPEETAEWQASLDAVTKAADSSGIVLPLIGYLANSKDWELVFSDGLTVVFMKNVPENRRIVERYKLPKQFLTYHIITEMVHYTYLGVSKQYVYATVSGIYRSLGELDKANRFTEHFQAASRTPWIVRMLDGALS